ncbi:MAG: hypothetical protein ACR2PZ_21125 [Pseudomonadales bacterium]
MAIPFRLFLVALLGLSCSGTVIAEKAQSLKAVASWTGSGRVTQIGTNATEFLGTLKGIMYVETAAGALNEAFIECTAKQTLKEKSQTSISGNCGIVVSGEDNVYATYQCAGEPGACSGRFKLTEGTGRFKGISGESPMTVRSPLRFLANDLHGQESITISHGVLILSDLSYSVRGGSR